MTDLMPPAPDLPPLLTDDDVLDRVESLVGSARQDRTLWLLPVDGDRRQAPLVVPVEDVPYLPDDVVEGIGTVLAGFVPRLATASGPGSVVLVLERFGPATVHPADRDWADALTRTCAEHDVVLRGFFVAASGGVVRVD
ncbi:hypothetical protein WCD74_26275 [Actinomycetospora sp. OC33-EN08]|uniref:Uncharacterized protein n=1 Tax=Actinomycetospora aurantiaca TaxID=3129233 RepID=A0ABU8MVF3_9PSEU